MDSFNKRCASNRGVFYRTQTSVSVVLHFYCWCFRTFAIENGVLHRKLVFKLIISDVRDGSVGLSHEHRNITYSRKKGGMPYCSVNFSTTNHTWTVFDF